MKQESSSCVKVGSVVTVQEEGWDEVQQFQLVLPHESSSKGDLISVSSPFGQAILNCSQGATITVAAPAGDIRFQVLAIA